jgi:hypothetical protein
MTLSIVGLIVVIHPWPKPQYASNNDHPTNCNHCLKHDRPRMRNLRVLGSADTAANDNMGMDTFPKGFHCKVHQARHGPACFFSTVAAIRVSADSFLPPESQLPACYSPSRSSRSVDRVYLAFKATKSASASCEERHGPRCGALDTLPGEARFRQGFSSCTQRLSLRRTLGGRPPCTQRPPPAVGAAREGDQEKLSQGSPKW